MITLKESLDENHEGRAHDAYEASKCECKCIIDSKEPYDTLKMGLFPVVLRCF